MESSPPSRSELRLFTFAPELTIISDSPGFTNSCSAVPWPWFMTLNIEPSTLPLSTLSLSMALTLPSRKGSPGTAARATVATPNITARITANPTVNTVALPAYIILEKMLFIDFSFLYPFSQAAWKFSSLRPAFLRGSETFEEVADASLKLPSQGRHPGGSGVSPAGCPQLSSEMIHLHLAPYLLSLQLRELGIQPLVHLRPSFRGVAPWSSALHTKTTSRNEVNIPGSFRYRGVVMRTYGQFCPVAQAAELLTERWTPLVIRELLAGSRRFNDIQRGVPLMSSALLSERLKTLERFGVVERRPRADGQGHEYSLTTAGEELRPLVEQMGVWGQRWVRRKVTPEDADPALLMWDMRRNINTERLPDRRVVVHFSFRGVPKGKVSWWLILDRPEPDLCLSDPGFGVDLTVRTDAVTMAEVWVGDVDLAGALRSRRITLEGPSRLRRAFPRWLILSPLTGVKRQTAPLAARRESVTIS